MTNEEFKFIRLDLCMSQAKLAEELDISIRQISRIECGVCDVSRAIALAMKYLQYREKSTCVM